MQKTVVLLNIFQFFNEISKEQHLFEMEIQHYTCLKGHCLIIPFC